LNRFKTGGFQQDHELGLSSQSSGGGTGVRFDDPRGSQGFVLVRTRGLFPEFTRVWPLQGGGLYGVCVLLGWWFSVQSLGFGGFHEVVSRGPDFIDLWSGPLQAFFCLIGGGSWGRFTARFFGLLGRCLEKTAVEEKRV